MARKRLKLDYDLKPELVTKAFSGLGEDARDYLESIVVYEDDPGRRSLAREILGYAHNQPETKIKKNVEG